MWYMIQFICTIVILPFFCISAHESFRIRAMTQGFDANSKDPEIVGGELHNCYRTCREGDKRTCHYSFTLTQYTSMSSTCGNCPVVLEDCYKSGCISAGGHVRPVTVANSMLPGPSIQVCEGDKIEVDVFNTLRSDSATIHWHGMYQLDSPFMDGTPYLTQCPILPHNKFKYEFTAQPAGTHIWHSHIGYEEADGLYGSLIVRKINDSLSVHYDYDLAEHVMIIWHWYPSTTVSFLQTARDKSDRVVGSSLLINGLASDVEYNVDNTTYTTPRAIFHVTEGKRYRFRAIHNSALYCPVQVSVDNHTLLMIASDGGNFAPIEVDSFMINAGERYDFVLIANQIPSNYWIRHRGIGSCAQELINVTQGAILHYNGVEIDEPSGSTTYEDAFRQGVLLNPTEMSEDDYPNNTIIKVVDLDSTEENSANISGVPDQTLYLKIDLINYPSFQSPGPYPLINDIAFEYPPIPLLTQYNEITEDMYCTEDNDDSKDCIGDYCTCPVVHSVSLNSLVELVLVDVGPIGGHPMHLHGHKFHVVTMEPVGKNISFEDIKNKNEAGLIHKKLSAAPVKDTVNIPDHGFTIIRFLATNPGYWFFHCHISHHAELGMGIVLKVGEHEEMIHAPKNFPRCGNWNPDTK